MKYILFVLVMLFQLAYAGATYQSFTEFASTDGYKGLREQIEHVSEDVVAGRRDITISSSIDLPYNISLVNMTRDEAYQLPLSETSWCSNGMLRVKVYVPPHISDFLFNMQLYPNNYAMGFITYIPNDEINEKSGWDDWSDYDFMGYYRALWAEHKTVPFVISPTVSFTITDWEIENFNIDTTNGGYLYISVTQFPDIFESARDYDYRYQWLGAYYVNFKKPFTEAMRQDVLAAIPEGQTEPAEPAQHLYTKECSAPYDFMIDTEPGEAVNPQELCEANNGTYVNDTCYYLPGDQVKYDCEITNNDYWNGSRCVTQEETDCNAMDNHYWYIGGNECLYTFDQITTADSPLIPSPQTLIQERTDAAYKISYYEANSEGWSTNINVLNHNATSSTVQAVKVLSEDGQRELGEFAITVEKESEWAGRLFVQNNVLTLEGKKNTNDLTTQKMVLNSNDHKGIVIVQPENPEVLKNNDQLTVVLKYGLNLTYTQPGTSSSSSSAATSSQSNAAAEECEARGGSYIYETGQCLGAEESSSSSARSSSQSSSSVKSSSSSSVVSSSKSASSVDNTAAEECEADGGLYIYETGQCLGGSSSSTGGETGEKSELEQIESYVAGKTYAIDGWFAQYDFDNVEDAFDWTFTTASGSVYQLRGAEPTEESVFGWKRVYVTPEEPNYVMVQIYDWDNDGSGKFDWLVINIDTLDVFKLAGETAEGYFDYLDGTVDIGLTINDDDTVTFYTKPGQ